MRADIRFHEQAIKQFRVTNAETSGNPFSAKRIANTLTSTGRKTARKAIDNYIETLKHAPIMREACNSG